MKIPRAESRIEATLALHLRAAGITDYEREYRFDSKRQWRFDFAWPAHWLAVECEGGTWSAGRHTRGSGFAADCEKYNAAQMIGFRVLRYTSEHINSGAALKQIQHALKRA